MRTMSQQKRDYYEVLGIDKTADPATIKKAYRKLAKKYHPDSNVGNEAAAEKFKEVNEAYDILCDPEKKKLYDQFGHAAFDGTGAAGAGSYGANGGFGSDGSFTGGFGGFSGNGGFRGFHTSDGHTFHFEGGEGDDIFGDIFGNMFGGGKKSRFTGGFHQGGSGFNGFHGYSGFGADPSSEKGSDTQAEINISFDDAAFGADRVITLSDANGKSQNLKVHIPAGINEGQSIRLKGKGNPGIGGAEAGDLLLKVHVGTRPGYERKGMDVYTSTEVPFTTAVLGGEIIVPTLYGNVSCKLREGTRCGLKIRLAGKGIVSMKDPKVKGDQYVTIQIAVPQNLTAEAKEKLREFAAACEKGRRGGRTAA